MKLRRNSTKDIKSTVNFIELGGKVKVSNYYSINNGENYINSLYLGKDNDKLDLNYYKDWLRRF